MKSFLLALGFAPLVAMSCSSSSSSPSAPADDGGVTADAALGESFSFVVVGCNRLEGGDTSASNPSTANVAQLSRTFEEVAALDSLPKFFFFAGDMVLGYADAATLDKELRAWVKLYEDSPLRAAGVTLIPLPGNHESQQVVGGEKLAYVEAEQTWLDVMKPYIRGSNGPAKGGDDALASDQSQLTYSFDESGTHFVVLNTDPVGKDWQVPTAWVAKDVSAARANGAKHVFAIGHKPAYPKPSLGDDGLSHVPAARDAFWNALEDAQAEAMFAAHNHLWWKTQPKTTWQIIAGNGGSKLETGVTGKDAYYGFTLVEVDAGGGVTAKSYGRDLPSSGYNGTAAAADTPTTIRDTVDLTRQ